MIVHDLKAWPHYFRPTWDGEKLFDVRYDDRGFQRGDLVHLLEWDRDATCQCRGGEHPRTCSRYTGRRILAEIGYVMGSTPGRGSRPGFTGNGYVVLSLINLDRVDGARLAGVKPNSMAKLMGGVTTAQVVENIQRARGGVVPEQRKPATAPVVPCTSAAGHKTAADGRTCIRCHATFPPPT